MLARVPPMPEAPHPHAPSDVSRVSIRDIVTHSRGARRLSPSPERRRGQLHFNSKFVKPSMSLWLVRAVSVPGDSRRVMLGCVVQRVARLFLCQWLEVRCRRLSNFFSLVVV